MRGVKYLISFFLLITKIYADCTSPVGITGAIEYSSTLNSHIYCNGTEWKTMKKGGFKESYAADLTTFNFSNTINDIAVVGNTLYTVNVNSLDLYDLTDPKNITLFKTYAFPGFTLEKSGNYLHLLALGGSYKILDISDPNNVFEVGSLSLTSVGSVSSMVVDTVNNYTYLASYSYDRIFVIDTSNMALPSLATTVTHATDLNGPSRIVKDGVYLFALNTDGNAIATINISIPALSYVEAIKSLSPTFSSSPLRMALFSHHLYVTKDVYSPSINLAVFDATDPLNINLVNTSSNYARAYDVQTFNDTLYVTNEAGANYFTLLDPNSPASLKSLNTVSVFNYIYYETLDVNENWVVSVSHQLKQFSVMSNTNKLILSNNTTGTYFDGDQEYESWGQMSFSRKVGNKLAVHFSSGTTYLFDTTNPASLTTISSDRINASIVNNTYTDGFDFDGSYVYRGYVNSPSYIEIIDMISDPNNHTIKYFTATEISGTRDIVVSGNTMYVASSYNDRLVAVDVTNKASPVVLGYAQDTTYLDGLSDIHKIGNYIVGTAIFSTQKYFSVVDVSNPATPTYLGSVVDSTAFSSVSDIECSGTYCFVANFSTTNIYVVDISTPSAPVITTTIPVSNTASFLQVVGNYLYSSKNTVDVIDISNLLSPVNVKNFNPGLSGWETIVDGSNLYLISNYVYSYNHPDPTTFTQIGNSKYVGKLSAPTGIDVLGNYAYVVNSSGNNMLILDVSDKTNPSAVYNFVDSNLAGAKDLKITGNYALVLATSSLLIYDLSSPLLPSLVGTLTLATELGGVARLFIEGNYALITAKTNSRLNVIDITNKSSPSLVTSVSDAQMMGPDNLIYKSNKIYVVSSTSKSLCIFDATTLSSPSKLGCFVDSTYMANPNRVQVEGNYAIVSSSSGNGGGIYNISDPANISFVSRLSSSTCYDYLTFGDYGYFRTSSATYYVMSIADKTNPVTVGAQNYAASGMNLFGNAVLRDGYLYSLGKNRIEIIRAEVKNFSYENSAIFNFSHPNSTIVDTLKTGNYILMINGASRISVYEDNGSTLNLVKTYSFDVFKENGSEYFYAEGNYLYIYSSSPYGVYIFDISDMLNMTFVGSYASYSGLGGSIYKIHKNGNTLVLVGGGRIATVDITTPSAPTFIAKNTDTTYSTGVGSALVGNYLYACGTSSNLSVVDVSTPASVSQVYSLVDSTSFQNCYSIIHKDNYLYVFSYTLKKVTILDISTPTAPVIVSSISDAQLSVSSASMGIYNDTLFISGTSKVMTYDLTDKANPIELDSLSVSSTVKFALGANEIYFPYINNFTKYFHYKYEKIIPVGTCSNAGQMEFNTTLNVMTFCNGTNTLPLATSGAGGSGCTSPSAPAGTMNFLTPSNIYQFCDGTNWLDL